MQEEKAEEAEREAEEALENVKKEIEEKNKEFEKSVGKANEAVEKLNTAVEESKTTGGSKVNVGIYGGDPENNKLKEILKKIYQNPDIKTDDDELTKAIKNIINYANPGETNIIETGTGTGKVNLHYNDDSLKEGKGKGKGKRKVKRTHKTNKNDLPTIKNNLTKHLNKILETLTEIRDNIDEDTKEAEDRLERQLDSSRQIKIEIKNNWYETEKLSIELRRLETLRTDYNSKISNNDIMRRLFTQDDALKDTPEDDPEIKIFKEVISEHKKLLKIRDEIVEKIVNLTKETLSTVTDEEIKNLKEEEIKKLEILQKKSNDMLEKLEKILNIRFEKNKRIFIK